MVTKRKLRRRRLRRECRLTKVIMNNNPFLKMLESKGCKKNVTFSSITITHLITLKELQVCLTSLVMPGDKVL